MADAAASTTSKIAEIADDEITGSEIAGDVASSTFTAAPSGTTEIAGSEIAGSEIAGDSTAAPSGNTEIAGSEIAGSEIAGSEIAGDSTAAPSGTTEISTVASPISGIAPIVVEGYLIAQLDMNSEIAGDVASTSTVASPISQIAPIVGGSEIAPIVVEAAPIVVEAAPIVVEAAPVPAGKGKGQKWSHEDVLALLVAKKSFPGRNWRAIEKYLSEKGIIHSNEQCRQKFDALERSFIRIKNSNHSYEAYSALGYKALRDERLPQNFEEDIYNSFLELEAADAHAAEDTENAPEVPENLDVVAHVEGGQTTATAHVEGGQTTATAAIQTESRVESLLLEQLRVLQRIDAKINLIISKKGW